MKDEPRSVRSCVRDRHGRPVPYINLWSEEMPESRWEMRYDAIVNMQALAVPSGYRGFGLPDFTKQAPDRQRECMLTKRCQVCRGKGEWIVVSNAISTKAIEFRGRPTLVIIEPWLCEPCATFAMRVCPGLIRRRRDEDLIAVMPTAYQLGFSRGWIEGPHEFVSKRVMPAMWGELHLRAGISHTGERLKFGLGPGVSP